jgi:hypothetical protein
LHINANEGYLECAVCGDRIPIQDAIRMGWKAYGPPAEGEDLFHRSKDATLSIRCNLCALGSVILGEEMNTEGEPALEEAIEHYRKALQRREWAE